MGVEVFVSGETTGRVGSVVVIVGRVSYRLAFVSLD